MFPYGFGEENDFALRAGDKGFRRVVVPWVHVFHHKTKSYTVRPLQAPCTSSHPHVVLGPRP